MKKFLLTLGLALTLTVSASSQWVHGVFASSAGGSTGYTTQYQALLDEWAVDPTGDTLTWQNALVDSLVTRGYWTRMDGLWVLANNTEANALINWLNPSAGTYDLVETGAGSLTFTRFSHVVSDGTNYYTSNMDLSSEASNFALNDGTIAVYIRDNSQQGGSAIGVVDATSQTRITARDYADTFYGRLNASTSLSNASTNSSGFWQLTRTASNATEIYRAGASFDSETDASNTVPSGADFKVFTRDASTMVTHQISIVYIMDGISDNAADSIDNYFETYMDNIGAGVQ